MSSQDEVEVPFVAIQVLSDRQSKKVGGAVYKRAVGSIEESMKENAISPSSIELFEFIDNDQFSCLDALLNQIGKAIVYVSDEFDSKSRGDGRKVYNLLSNKNIETIHMKKSSFTKKPETAKSLQKLTGQANQFSTTMSAETDRPLAFGAVECLLQALRLLDDDENLGRCDLLMGTLGQYMRMDTAASDAVMLLPKPDDPFQFGSIYGILNRCKTKMGSRLLERWLRQPLLDAVEINHRLNVVQAFKESVVSRNQLRDGVLKSIPDLNSIAMKMHKRSAGLGDLYGLYLFARSIPRCIDGLRELIENLPSALENSDSSSSSSSIDEIISTVTDKFVKPLEMISNKFQVFQQLVEHVVDFDQLPDLKVNAQYDKRTS